MNHLVGTFLLDLFDRRFKFNLVQFVFEQLLLGNGCERLLVVLVLQNGDGTGITIFLCISLRIRLFQLSLLQSAFQRFVVEFIQPRVH